MVDFARLLSSAPKPLKLAPPLILGFTGHRPHKLDSEGREPGDPHFNGYQEDNELRLLAREEMRRITREVVSKATRPPEGRVTPVHVSSLAEDEMIVFGSNKLGIHGIGSALYCRQNHGAEPGVGEGPTGKCYALPTKRTPHERATLDEVAQAVESFERFARQQVQTRFLVLEVGCKYAGFTPAQIAPLFAGCANLRNVCLPESFWRYLVRETRYVTADYAANKLRGVKWHSRPVDWIPDFPIGVSGMALGGDTDIVRVWIEERFPFVAAVPFPGQESRWPKRSQDLYLKLYQEWAIGVRMVSTQPAKNDAEARRLLLERDDWVVGVCDEMISLFDGSRGGTAHTYAAWQRMHVADPHLMHRIDPRDLRRWLKLPEVEGTCEVCGSPVRQESRPGAFAECPAGHIQIGAE